jgi:hypothetical protein
MSPGNDTSASRDVEWPAPLNDTTSKTRKAKSFDAKVEIVKKHAEAVDARSNAEVQAELDLNAEYYKAIFEVGKGSLDRARSGATAVVTAAAAIVTLYTGLLGATFAADKDLPLPARGAVPAILLGAAIVFSTFYLAYIGRAGSRWVAAPRPTSSLRSAELRRAVTFLSWMRESAVRRSYWLRASVLALGIGVMLLPAPFLALGQVKVPVVHWTFGEATTAAPAQSKPDWPGTPTETSSPKLQKIVYAAQVQEAADARKASPSAPGPSGVDGFWFALGGLGLLLCLGLAFVGGRGQAEPANPKQPDGLPTAARET